MRFVASTTLTAHGIPSSRLTMTAWLFMAPTSTITPAAGTNSGVQDGSVFGATRMSPGSSASGSPGSSRTRAVPLATPAQPGEPASTSPDTATVISAAPLRARLDSGGTPLSPSTKYGGSSDQSSFHAARRSPSRSAKAEGTAM